MMKKLIISSAEGFSGMTIFQELAIQKPPIGQIIALVDQARKAEGADIAKMDTKFNVKYHSYQEAELKDAMKEADMLLLIPPAEASKRHHTEMVLNCAMECGVKRILMLSSIGLEESDKASMREFLQLENTVKSKCKECVILRAGFYCQNLLLYSPQIRQGILPAPIGHGKMSMVDLADVGVALVRMVQECASSNSHSGKIYSFTGPESLTGEQIAQQMSEVLGKSIQFKDISRNEAEKILTAAPAIDPYEAKYLLEFYDLVKADKMDFVTQDFQNLTGLAPTPLKEFFEKYKDDILGTTKAEE